ncbi:unnamed protein product [Effrenium voratum]|nr:unnamed protein product [Effrenium voratum]
MAVWNDFADLRSIDLSESVAVHVSAVRCCCFGPVGPIFWFVVACMHYCKPAEVRKQLPMERQVACVSLTTALITTILEVVLIIAIIAWWSQIISSADAAGEGRVESFWLDV